MVTRATIKESFWNLIYDRIKDQVSDPKNRAAKWIWSLYPDNEIDEKSDYPIMIIRPAKVTFPKGHHTQTKRKSKITIRIEAYAVNPAYCDQIIDDATEALESYIGVLNVTHNIHFPRIESAGDEPIKRSGFKAHLSWITFACDYVRDKP